MFSKGIAMHVPLILFHNPWNCTIQSILNDGKLVAMYHLFDSWSKRWIMRWRTKSIDHRMQRVTNRDTRLIYICESWISLFINSPVSSRMYLFWKKISPLRISTNSTQAHFPSNAIETTVDTRFFTFTIASALSSGWTTNERYPLETFFKERRAFSRKWHAAEAYKRAAQVSSLLEAVFNRSPWN